MSANIIWFVGLFNKIRGIFEILFKKDNCSIMIVELDLPKNPNYNGTWGQRPISFIDKIVIHQALSEADTVRIHNYHTSENCHLRTGGAPKIAYHYTIEKCGTIYKVNELTDVVWHCYGQNMHSVGILVIGDFDGPVHIGKSCPTEKQLKSLNDLLRFLQKELSIEDKYIYGHYDFGKQNCPGNEMERFIKRYKSEGT